MSYTANISTLVEVKDDSGNVLARLGDARTDVPRQITCDGEKYDVEMVVADNYTRVVVWQDGDAGMGDFDVLAIKSDKDVLVEFAIDRAGSPAYGVAEVVANVPYVRTSDDMVAAVLANGSSTTLDQIDQIAIKRNVADGEGDATVRVLLVS